MCARIIPPLLLAVALFSACNGDKNAASDVIVSQAKAIKTQTQELPQALKPTFTVLELKRSGGIKCPAAGETNAENLAEDLLCASVTLSYPEASLDANPEMATALNALILQQMVDDPEREADAPALSLEQFADSFIAEYQKDPNPFTSWALERDMSVAFDNNKLLSLLFQEYGYTGGAHPSGYQRYTVLSLSDGKPIKLTLADLFSPGYETPLNVIGEKIFRATRGLDEAANLEEQGFSFANNVFMLNENFGILQDGLEFIFNSYEVAPYAMGPTQFTIPYEDIQSLIAADGPLGHTIQ